jgi:hypothetical protein
MEILQKSGDKSTPGVIQDLSRVGREDLLDPAKSFDCITISAP